MDKTVILLATVAAGIGFTIWDSGQVNMFLVPQPLIFVLVGGLAMFFAVPADRENLLIERLEAFRYGCTLFGVIGVLIGFIAIMASMDNPKMIGPALAFALLTLLWAAGLNYIAKLVIISKSNGSL